MLANDVGTGKTFTFLFCIIIRVMQIFRLLVIWRELPREMQLKEEMPIFLPTLIIMPVNLITQTYTAGKTIFNGKLFFKLWFGSSIRASGVERQADTIDFGDWGNVMQSLMDNKDKEETGRTVILTTYNTLVSRNLETNLRKFRFVDDDTREKYEEKYTTDSDGKVIVGVDELSFEDIEFLSAEEQENPNADFDGVEKSYKLRHFEGLTSELCFARIILDESHQAKRKDGKVFQFLIRQPYKAIHFVSATPMMNSIVDMLNPILLTWRLLGIDGVFVPGNQYGDVAGIYQPDYDPYKGDQEVCDGRFTCKGIFSDSVGQLDPVVEQMRHIYDSTEGKVRAWLFSPHVFLDYASAKEANTNTSYAQDLIRPVLQAIQRRRRMQSRLVLPDGSISYPGSDMQPSEIKFQETPYGGDYEQMADFEINNLLSNQAVPRSKQLANKVVVDEHGRQPNEEADGAAEMVNFVARHANMVSFDMENANITRGREADPDLTTFHDEIAQTKAIWERTHPPGATLPDWIVRAAARNDAHLEKNAREREERERNRAQPTKMKKKLPGTEDAPTAALTAEFVDHVIGSDLHGGLGYLRRLRAEDPKCPTLSNSRAENLRYFLMTSPVARETIGKIRGVLDEKPGAKVLIMCDIPYIQMELAALCAMTGWNTLSMKAHHTEEERAKACAQFNDPDSEVQVMLVSMSLAAAGLDLHGSCHTGIFTNIGWNFNVHKQAIGRLERIGHMLKVTWYFMKPRGSYYDYMEMTLCVKWFDQLSAESAVPDHIRCGVRLACIGEVARNYMGTPFNRVAWIVMKDARLQMSWTRGLFNSDMAIRLGFFFSHIAGSAMQMTEHEYLSSAFVDYEEILDVMAFKFAEQHAEHILYRYTDDKVRKPGRCNEYVNQREQVLAELDKVDLGKLFQSAQQVKKSKGDEEASFVQKLAKLADGDHLPVRAGTTAEERDKARKSKAASMAAADPSLISKPLETLRGLTLGADDTFRPVSIKDRRRVEQNLNNDDTYDQGDEPDDEDDRADGEVLGADPENGPTVIMETISRLASSANERRNMNRERNRQSHSAGMTSKMRSMRDDDEPEPIPFGDRPRSPVTPAGPDEGDDSESEEEDDSSDESSVNHNDIDDDDDDINSPAALKLRRAEKGTGKAIDISDDSESDDDGEESDSGSDAVNDDDEDDDEDDDSDSGAAGPSTRRGKAGNKEQDDHISMPDDIDDPDPDKDVNMDDVNGDPGMEDDADKVVEPDKDEAGHQGEEEMARPETDKGNEGDDNMDPALEAGKDVNMGGVTADGDTMSIQGEAEVLNQDTSKVAGEQDHSKVTAPPDGPSTPPAYNGPDAMSITPNVVMPDQLVDSEGQTPPASGHHQDPDNQLPGLAHDIEVPDSVITNTAPPSSMSEQVGQGQEPHAVEDSGVISPGAADSPGANELAMMADSKAAPKKGDKRKRASSGSTASSEPKRRSARIQNKTRGSG